MEEIMTAFLTQHADDSADVLTLEVALDFLMVWRRRSAEITASHG